MKKPIRTALAATAAALVLALPPVPARADSAAAPAAGPVTDPAGASELGPVVDRAVSALLAADRIPGAAVVVVEGGRTVFCKGYGMADVTGGRPVDCATPFLTGSLAKVFTAEAVLQLVGEGRIDLHADVNRYLTAFTIEDTYPGRPVTVQNLLTYTAGFDEDIVGLAEKDPAGLPSLAASLKARQPPRVRPPGTRIAYDNYGMALAGHLVEEVSGRPFAQYVAEHVFAAHDMTGSSAALPHPAPIGERLARGYRPDGAGQVEQKGQYAPWTPSGTGPAVTPDDMGRYLAAQLRGGPVARAMQQTHITAHEGMPGMGYVLEHRPRGGRPVLWKDGDVPGFHSAMALMPEQGFGVYVVVNGDGLAAVGPWDARRTANLIIDTRFPAPQTTAPQAPAPGAPAPGAPVPGTAAADASRYTGSYRSARTSRTSLMKLSTLFSVPTVKANADATLTTTGLSPDPQRHTQHWTPIAPGLFQEHQGQARIAFTGDGVLVSSELPSEVYEKLSWYDSPTLDLPLFATGSAALLLAALGLPLAAAARRIRKRRPSPRPARLALLTAWTSCALTTALLTGLALLTADPNVLMAAVPLNAPELAALPVLATAALAFAAPMAPACVAAWRRGWWTRTGRITYTLLTLGAAAFFTVAVDYHLVLLP
ncbi:serine hydrolase domain-containing protein [Kitasatospora sp. NPDC054939]